MRVRKAKWLTAAAAASVILSAVITSPSHAWEPTQPVRLVVPFAPGGSNDVIARTLGKKISDVVGQPVVIENRPGAGGSIGSLAVSRATPDGHTILVNSNAIVLHPLLNTPTYDPLKDFSPVSIVTKLPFVVVTKPDFPANDFPEFVRHVRSNSANLFFGTGGSGSAQHISQELFNAALGVRVEHVPFKGSGESIIALMGGNVDYSFDIIPSVKPLKDSGKLNVLAQTGLVRSPVLPDVPTIKELGDPDYSFEAWQGIFLPKGTAPEIVEKWAEVVKESLSDPEIHRNFTQNGYEVVGSSPAELVKVMADDTASFKRVIAEAGIRVN